MSIKKYSVLLYNGNYFNVRRHNGEYQIYGDGSTDFFAYYDDHVIECRDYGPATYGDCGYFCTEEFILKYLVATADEFAEIRDDWQRVRAS
tara:strand:+ start:233 stop:505 length:273 start_codon:yes stop_codon:yes gene_type:complete